jgi:penicillin G amidase
MRLFGAMLSALILAATVYMSAWGAGGVPALGALLDPARGAWTLGRVDQRPLAQHGAIPQLGDSVRVIYDDRGVPHIFASTVSDAQRALGYVVARDRLFQLEINWRAGAGRLTELAGGRTLPVDRNTRLLGLPAAAERKMAALDSTSTGWKAIHDFAEGVNAYIDGLSAADYPMEYRLLGARPARWEPINSIHLMNRMGQTLSFNPTEMTRLRAAAMVGWEATDVLFPYHSPLQEPIQPAPGAPRLEMPRIPAPGPGDREAREALQLAGAVREGDTTRGDLALMDEAALDAIEAGALGSNSWAVSPHRSASGHALLAGDPHLELSLPSIWYEVHIVVPGEIDVYGVTFVGAPWVVVGFNRDIAWTFTNHDADVVDFYAEEVDESAMPGAYRLDGEWVPLEHRIERYLDRTGAALAVDTIPWSHRGPMRRAAGRWLSMRWTVHDPWEDDRLLHDINRARTVDEFLKATAPWIAPSQNMLVADRQGSIAVRSTGSFPIRPNGARGDVIQDGRSRTNDWAGYLPVESYPFGRDPAQGFLATANQQSVHPRVSPGYLGSVWPAPWRALRINQLLRADSAVTPDAMRRYQTDPGSARADFFAPAFVAAAERAALAGNDSARVAGVLLREWDRRYTKDNERAVLFEAAMGELSQRTWDELLEHGTQRLVANPGDVMLAALLQDPDNAWWNDRRTERRELRDDVLAASLIAAHATVVARHGAPEAGGWRWDRIRHANIHHLLQLPNLGALAVPVQGGPGLLNPSFGDGRHGASWRMVVELGPEVRAWATYPGGQSGHPLSPNYRNRVPQWSAGELDQLFVPRTPQEIPEARMQGALWLRPR